MSGKPLGSNFSNSVVSSDARVDAMTAMERIAAASTTIMTLEATARLILQKFYPSNVMFKVSMQKSRSCVTRSCRLCLHFPR